MHVDRVAVAPANLAPVRVVQRIDQPVGDGAQHPRGHHLTRLPKAGMDGRRDIVECRQDLIGEIELPVHEDVHLGPEQYHKRRKLVIDALDQRALFFEPLRREPAGHGQILGMVGQRHVLIPLGFGCPGHVLERLRPIGPIGVGMQVALDVA